MASLQSTALLVSRARRAARRYGLMGTVTMAAKHVAARIASRLRPSVRAQAQQRHVRAAEFDQRYGVDTGGLVYQTELKMNNPHQLHAKRYEGSDPLFFRNAINLLPISHERFCFVDLGSGKGRAVLLATEFPFARVVGVEFARELHEVAQKNVVRFRPHMTKCRDVEVVCMDALAYPLPPQPLVCFLGDPFDGPLMAQLVATIVTSMRQLPRDLYVVYYNPRSGHLFDDSASFVRVAEVGPVRIWRGVAGA